MNRVFLILAILTVVPAAHAQEVVLGDQDASQPTSSWASRCVAASRTDGLDCSVSERAVAQGTGQLIGAAEIRIPAAGGAPLLTVTAPLGLYIPGGLGIDIDGANPQAIDLQACDRGGCYGSAPASDALLAALRQGKTLDIVFQNLGKQTAKLPLPLAGFGAAYDKIK